MLICLDPGHGGRDRSNRGPTGYVEADGTLAMALACREALKGAGMQVIMTRETDKDLAGETYSQVADLAGRVKIANDAGADFYVSIHTNAAGSTTAHGTETFCYKWGGQGEKLARAIQDAVVFALGTADRGVKTANFHVLRETKMPAALVEVAFHTNPEEEAKLKDPAFSRKAGEAITRGILKFLGYQVPTPPSQTKPKEEAASAPPPAGTPILGPARTTIEQAKAWAKSRGATEEFIGLADLYWTLAPQRGGVEPTGAYCQAAKETGFGRFGGVIDASYHNPCGLKTRQGGDNYDPAAHQRFATWEEGVTAHLDHLALYAKAPGYPREDTPDPRHFAHIAGVANTYEALGGRWAPNPEYGISIVRNYLADLLAFKFKEPAVPFLAEIERLKQRVAELQARLAAIKRIVEEG